MPSPTRQAEARVDLQPSDGYIIQYDFDSSDSLAEVSRVYIFSSSSAEESEEFYLDSQTRPSQEQKTLGGEGYNGLHGHRENLGQGAEPGRGMQL